MSITGNLRTLEFAELLQWLSQGQKTGALVIKNASSEKRIYFNRGKIISSESNNPEEHLGKYMVREGLLDQETLSRAIKLQESTQILLGKVLVTLGTISEEELHRILRRKTEESLYELFNWDEGDFRFVPDEKPRLPMVPLEIDVTNIVLEGAKRLDEARRDGREGTGNYGDEIENVLSSEIFQGIEVSDSDEDASGPVPVVESEEEEEVSALSVPATTAAEEKENTEEPTYQPNPYHSGSTATAKTHKAFYAAAAALVAIAVGVGAYFVMRPDPAVGTADRDSLNSGSEFEATLDPTTSILPAHADGTGTEIDSEAPANQDNTASGEDESDEIQARYEAELEALKQQLQQAQLAAAERDAALDRVAELEEQVAEAEVDEPEEEPIDEPAASPEAQFTVASLQNPLESSTFTAGGDELPDFVAPQPATEADREAGTDFASDMVEPAAPRRQPVEREPAPGPSTAVEAEEPERQQAAPTTEAQISPPLLLTPPKPRYPAAAVRLGREAVVTLRLLIDENGKVADVERVGKAQGMGFDKSAINAALGTSWTPGTRDGEPTEMWTEMRIAFKP